jgi:hypothetical protein
LPQQQPQVVVGAQQDLEISREILVVQAVELVAVVDLQVLAAAQLKDQAVV